MMGWLLGRRDDRADEAETIKLGVDQNVQAIKNSRLALEKVIEKMKKDRANAARE